MENVSSSNGLKVSFALAPKLRFKSNDNTDYPDYRKEKVGTLFKHINKRNKDLSNNNVITNSAEYGLIPQRDFFDKDIAVEGNTENYYIIEKGDFVYNPRKSTTAPYGPFNCYKYDEIGIVSPLYTCLKPIDYGYTNYLLWYFKSPVWYSYIYHNGAQGGARHDRVGMTNELMDGIPINIPCIEEQQKISSFLTLLDEKITKQRELVKNLKSYKRGVLSAIFKRKIRFKDENGNEFPKWEYIKFSELYKQVFEKNDGSFGTDKIISVANMYFKGDVSVGSSDYLKSYNICRLGDIAFEGNKSKNYSFGRLVENDIGDGIVSHVFIVFRPIKAKHNIDYWKIAINYEQIMGRILSKCTKKSTMMTDLVPSDFLKQSIFVPCEEEQRKIADFVSIIDKKINAETSVLEKAQSQKDELLRRLFI